MMTEIDRQDAEEYIRLHAQAATIEKQMVPLKEKILPALVAGAISPAELPFLLVNQPQNRAQKDWPGVVLRLLTAVLGRTRGAGEFKRLDAKWKTKEIPSLCVVKNVAYAAQLGKGPEAP